MANRKQTIAVKVITRTGQFKKGMNSAGGTLDKFAQRLSIFDTRLLKGGAALVAFGAAASALKDVFREMEEGITRLDGMIKMARHADVGVEAFQAWSVAAGRAGLESGTLGKKLQDTDAKLKEFNIGQGELAGKIKAASKETQEYFETLKGVSTEDFLVKLEEFFLSSASEADKATVSLGLFTTEATVMRSTIEGLGDARATLEGGDLLLSEAEAQRIEYAADALDDIRRHTQLLKDKAIAGNVEQYLATQQGLEELRIKWAELLITVGEVAVKVADAMGITTTGEMVSAVRRLSVAQNSQLIGWTHSKEAVEGYQETVKGLFDFQVTGIESQLRAERLLKVALEERQSAQDGQYSFSRKEEKAQIEKYDIIIARLQQQLSLIKEKNKEEAKGAAGVTGGGAEGGKPPPPAQLSYYDKLIESSKRAEQATRDQEDALFRLADEFADANKVTGYHVIAQENLMRQMGITTGGMEKQVTAMDRVIQKTDLYKANQIAAGKELAAAEQALKDGTIGQGEFDAVYGEKDKPPTGPPPRTPIWELDGRQKSELFLRDFQSFSGSLAEAMLDSETDWESYWANMLKTMATRNLARYISGAFDSAIGAIGKGNDGLVSEAKETSSALSQATGKGGSGGGFAGGWAGIVGGIATIGATYLLSKSLSKTNSAATGAASGGDVEVVVNINNSTNAEVLYSGKTVSSDNGVKRTVIDIVVEDYSQGGVLREVLG